MAKTNLEIIKDFLNNQKNGDLNAALDLIDNNAEWHTDSVNGSWSGSHFGKKDIIKHFNNTKREVKSFSKTTFDLTASENLNLVYEYGKIELVFPHNNQFYETYTMSIYEVKNNKIISYRILEDSNALYHIYNKKG